MECGVGSYSESLARALARRPDVEVAVLADRRAAEREPDEPYKTYAVIETWRGEDFKRVEELVRDFKPDIIHIQYPTLAYTRDLPWLLPAYLWRFRAPVVQTWHEYYPNEIGPTWRDFALALTPGGVIVVRPRYLQTMPWWYRLLLWHKPFVFIPNASSIPKVVLSPAERAEIRARYVPAGKSLVSFFGFFYEHKGIDDLIEAVDPEKHHLLLVGSPQPGDPYQAKLLERLSQRPLSTFISLAGYLPGEDAARVLAASDAVALPYRRGGGSWNTSIQAAVLQGTFTLSTSFEEHGYDPWKNIYYARPGDVADLREGLAAHIGTRNLGENEDNLPPTWENVVERHLAFYSRHLKSS
ncbi:MAG: glycosyltransferase [Gemmatimonadales bacterium]